MLKCGEVDPGVFDSRMNEQVNRRETRSASTFALDTKTHLKPSNEPKIRRNLHPYTVSITPSNPNPTPTKTGA
jgi:hypothetical protein